MSLTQPYERIFYIGNGITTTFSYLFEAINANFISVSVRHIDGSITENVDVIVNRDPAGHLIGTITFETPNIPQAGEIICITRQTPVQQATQYSRAINFNAKNIETSFDLVVAMIQELKEFQNESSLNFNQYQDEPFTIDLLSEYDDGATLVVDWQAKLIKKGLYFKIESGNLKVSDNGQSWIKIPKSANVDEFRQREEVHNGNTVYIFEYRTGLNWYELGRSGESDIGAIAQQALELATQNAQILETTAPEAHNAFELATQNAQILTEIVPEQASESNKLADKNFVNSSIGSATANFKGTFNSLAELEAVAGPTPNDYGFVIGTDAQGNTVYNRYKYTGSAWAFEYALNNSSFTASQWAAINSGTNTTNWQKKLTAGANISISEDGTISASLTETTTRLLDFKWSDHLINDLSWLRADTFSWQNGSMYQTVYKHLRNDMYNWYSWENNGTTIYTKKAYPEVGEKAYSNSALTTEVGEITAVTDTLDITVEKITVNNVIYDSVSGGSITPTTETVGGITIQYIPAEDGHKIVTLFDESDVADIYTATGVAWYYIIDYGNRRFKLPRSKHEHYGNRPVVGNGIALGITDGTTNGGLNNSTGTDNSYVFMTQQYGATVGDVASSATHISSTDRKALGVTTDGTKSGMISTPVQDTDQYKYLYFYVGQFTQTATEQTAGLNAELFNGKQDILTGVSGGGDYVVSWQTPTAENNYTWYRKYKSGWVEQGGHSTSESSGKVFNFPIAMADINYTLTLGGGNADMYEVNRTTTSFQFNANASGRRNWQVSGMSAQE